MTLCVCAIQTHLQKRVYSENLTNCESVRAVCSACGNTSTQSAVLAVCVLCEEFSSGTNEGKVTRERAVSARLLAFSLFYLRSFSIASVMGYAVAFVLSEARVRTLLHLYGFICTCVCDDALNDRCSVRLL